MNIHRITVVLLASLAGTTTQMVAAQQTPQCDCAATFERVVHEVEHNYSGYPTKALDAAAPPAL